MATSTSVPSETSATQRLRTALNTQMAPPGDSRDERQGEWHERNQRLREARDRVQDLRTLLSGARNGDITPTELAGAIERLRDEVNHLLQALPGAEPVRRIVSLWMQVQAIPLVHDPYAALSVQEYLRQLGVLEVLCRKIVFQVALITIPERVNEWLRLARPGYYIPFHEVFADELPDFEERVQVLHYLAWAPRVLTGGLVNVELGLIYRYSSNPTHRYLTAVGVALAFLTASGLIVAACHLPLSDWPLQPTRIGTLLIGWAAVLVGVLVHIGISTTKQVQQQGGRPPIIAMEDALLWINARFGYILFKLLMALVGFFALAFTTGADKVTPFSMFLVGYGLDSVIEIFGVSLEQRAATRLGALKRRLALELMG
ncbi:MAG: hypothetical protein NZ765_05370 [Anaerolineae bacterium]|nr:hypothetical protein [Anaerolineae bacterium]MDW8070772.1 hypothetical protein [Anaerolineae bacterium]